MHVAFRASVSQLPGACQRDEARGLASLRYPLVSEINMSDFYLNVDSGDGTWVLVYTLWSLYYLSPLQDPLPCLKA